MRINKNIGIYILLGACILWLASCRKNEPAITQFTIDQFPLTVGNYWKFHHMGVFGAPSDTVILNIDSVKTLAAGSQTYFASARSISSFAENGFLYGTVTFTKTSTQIIVSGTQPEANFLGDMTMTFPIKNGNKWTGLCASDSFVVSYSDSVGAINTEVHNSYAIERHYNCDTASIVSSYFMSPGIGFFNVGINEQYTNALPNQVFIYLFDYKVQ